jgi:hypothetical protein
MRARPPLVIVLGLVLPLVLVAAAAAGPPVKTTIAVDSTFQSAFWSSACGVPVFIHQEGTIEITLVTDSNVIREVDTFPAFTRTVFSPADQGGTGKSFTYKTPAPIHFLYPEGTELGAPALIVGLGVFDRAAPGGPVIAGREVDSAVIVDHIDGVPLVDFVDVLSTAGHFPEFEAFVEARCAFLTDP